MDERRTRIQEDLRGLISGEVRCDDTFVQIYASDASIFQIRPLGVIRPRSKQDVVACVQYAAENQIPLHARGGGSGLAGQAIGPGLVIDFSCHLRRVAGIHNDSVRSQAGVVLDRLNAYLRPHGRMIGPDPATIASTTVGGMIGVNSGGSHWLRYGAVRQHVRSLEIVTANGEMFEIGREPIPHRTAQSVFSDDTASFSARTQTRQHIVARLAALLQRHRETIESTQPRSVVNAAGYHLAGIMADGRIDLPQLITGAEGTLALVTEATLSTVPLVEHRGVATFFFESLDLATRAVQEVLPLAPSACDLMDRRHLSLARDADPRYEALIPAAAEALLLVECIGESPTEVHDALRGLVDRVVCERRLAFDARQTFDPREVELFWQLTRHVVPNLYRLKGTQRAVPCLEDIAVPPEALPDFIVHLQNSLKRHQVTASLFAHAGQGQLHLRPLLNLGSGDDLKKLRLLADDLYRAVFNAGGTISGEHGDGLSRTAFLRAQYGPLYDVFREVKHIFDPQNIFNPGKIVGDENDLPTDRVRPVRLAFRSSASQTAHAQQTPEGEPAERAIPPVLLDLQWNWQADDVAQEARNCNGCGACRSQSDEVRMCPIFHARPREEASPRAKANLMRAIFTGQLPPEAILTDAFKAVADLCVHCHMCRIECPAAVDVPRMMAEAKGSYVATNGVRLHDWFLGHIDRLSSLASLLSPLANWMIGNRLARWAMEKSFGIAQGRKLPRSVSQPFTRRARRQRLTRPVRRAEPKVAYFVDTYANYHDPELAEALVSVFQHNGVAVYVPPAQRSSGMPLIATGLLDAAKRLAAQNIAILADAVRQGYDIVATEPSAAMCLRHEYPALLSDEDARLVADHTYEACSYLWNLHHKGRLKLNFRPLPTVLVYHTPCHLKALGTASAGENLLRLIPALRVHKTESGCSGMAGTYGLMRKNYRTSLRVGHTLMRTLRSSDRQAGTTECSACKIQMEQGTHKPTIHPLKVLALAYDLMPQIAERLAARSEELIVT